MLPFLVKAAIGWLILRAVTEDDDDDDDGGDDGGDAGDDDDDADDGGDDGDDDDAVEDGDPVSGQTDQGAARMRPDGRMFIACREDSGQTRAGTAPLSWWEAKPGNPCCKQASGETFTYGSGQIVCAYDDFTDRYKWKDVPK